MAVGCRAGNVEKVERDSEGAGPLCGDSVCVASRGLGAGGLILQAAFV